MAGHTRERRTTDERTPGGRAPPPRPRGSPHRAVRNASFTQLNRSIQQAGGSKLLLTCGFTATAGRGRARSGRRCTPPTTAQTRDSERDSFPRNRFQLHSRGAPAGLLAGIAPTPSESHPARALRASTPPSTARRGSRAHRPPGGPRGDGSQSGTGAIGVDANHYITAARRVSLDAHRRHANGATTSRSVRIAGV